MRVLRIGIGKGMGARGVDLSVGGGADRGGGKSSSNWLYNSLFAAFPVHPLLTVTIII